MKDPAPSDRSDPPAPEPPPAAAAVPRPAVPPIPAAPLRQAAPAALWAVAEGLQALLAGALPGRLTAQQRSQCGQRVRRAVPLLIDLAVMGMRRRPDLFPATQADALDEGQERAQALRHLYLLLRKLTDAVYDSYLSEQARVVDDALPVLRQARQEPPRPRAQAPRRGALRESLAWAAAACPYFAMRDGLVDSGMDELLAYAQDRATRARDRET